MYELINAAGNTYYIECPARMGLYVKNGTDAYLFDSGNNKEAGRKVRQVLENNSFTLKAIINTHSHADHVGGNAYLQKYYGCKVYAPGIESAITKYTILEPSGLYGGFPHKDLKHKFVMAEESDCEDLYSNLENLPGELEFISLPGHAFDMIAIKTSDDILFIADSVSSAATIEKYKIGYMLDIKSQLETLEKLSQLRASLFVPAHADPTYDLSELISLNTCSIFETKSMILSIIEKPCVFDEILSKVFSAYNLTMTIEQHALIGCTVRSFLSWLYNCGEAAIEICDNLLLWKRV